MRQAVCGWLIGQGMVPVFEVFMGPHTCDFIGVEFADRVGRRIPPVSRTMAIELKLDDVAGVICAPVFGRARVAEWSSDITGPPRRLNLARNYGRVF